MPQWIHDRAKHIRAKNPGMPESESFAIATQQAHAAGKSPAGYGTAAGRRAANRKYDRPEGAYEQKADPSHKSKTSSLAFWMGPSDEPRSKEKTMHTKLAGRLPLQAMIAQHIDAAREKLAAADDKEKAKKLIAFEKKEHGHIPSVKEERAEYEKTSSAIDPGNPEHIEKLASALDAVAVKLAGDGVFNGGESKQGGEQLATMGRVPGKQPWAKAKAHHQVPNHTGMMATIDNPGAATAIPTDDKRAPGGTGAKYPAKGVFKTASQSVMDRIQARKAEATTGVPATVQVEGEQPSAAVSYVLDKISEYQGGGEVLSDDKVKAPVPSNPGRQMISSNSAPASATKREAKAPRKKELKEVLTEPALTSSTDNVVQENLRNASKGGVKIAAAKAFLQKVASEGCTCQGGGSCRHCRLSKAIESRKAS